jgi:hypothetical protein
MRLLCVSRHWLGPWLALAGALLVAAGLGPPAEHALISLLAVNGLRVSKLRTPASRRLGSNGCTGTAPDG